MISKTIYKTSCDVKNCKNTAAYSFDTKGRLGKFYVCKTCLTALCEEGQRLIVPKSLKNAIKKAMDEKTVIKGVD